MTYEENNDSRAIIETVLEVAIAIKHISLPSRIVQAGNQKYLKLCTAHQGLLNFTSFYGKLCF